MIDAITFRLDNLTRESLAKIRTLMRELPGGLTLDVTDSCLVRSAIQYLAHYLEESKIERDRRGSEQVAGSDPGHASERVPDKPGPKHRTRKGNVV